MYTALVEAHLTSIALIKSDHGNGNDVHKKKQARFPSFFLASSLYVPFFASLSLFHTHTLIMCPFPPSQIKFLKVEMEKKTKIIKDLQQEVSPLGSDSYFLFSFLFVFLFFPSVYDARDYRDTATLGCHQLSCQWRQAFPSNSYSHWPERMRC